MAKAGHKYRLLIYEYMLNRWWPVSLLVALFVFLNVGVLWGAEWYYTNPLENPLPSLSTSGGTVMLAVGVISLVFSIFLLFTRKMAYVQLFDDHLRLVTPFLRLNISYKRVVRTTTAQLYNLFPPKSLSSWRRDLIGPISGNTVLVIHLTSYPLSRGWLNLFLSPFFFYDKSAHFVLILDDWMRFSTELDSRRFIGKTPRNSLPAPKPRRSTGLLDALNRK